MKFLLDLIRSPLGEVSGFICFFVGALYFSSIFSFASKDTIKQYKAAIGSQRGIQVILILAALMGLVSRIPFNYLVSLNHNRYPVSGMPSGEYCYEADVKAADGTVYENIPVSVFKAGSNSEVFALYPDSGKIDLSEGTVERNGIAAAKTEAGQEYEVTVSDQLTGTEDVPMMNPSKSVFGYLFDTVAFIGAFLLVYTVFSSAVIRE